MIRLMMKTKGSDKKMAGRGSGRGKLRSVKPAPRSTWPEIMNPSELKKYNIFPGLGINRIYSFWDDDSLDFPGRRVGSVHIVYIEDLIKWLDGDDVYVKFAPRFASDRDWTTDEDLRWAL